MARVSASRSALSMPTSQTMLVLQGGGALGAYQAGAYEALALRDGDVDWVAGVSIGAINAALIAGNPHGRRVARLRAFWERVTLPGPETLLLQPAEPWRPWWNASSAWWGACFGIPGFFRPRPWWQLWPQGSSLYDTAPLHDTLLELVDFDLLNDGPLRFSVDAVDVETGNLVHFDNRKQRIGPEHVMASGALPPGFPAVCVDGRYYWDGGLVSNTPLAHVMAQIETLERVPITVFQVDLFSAQGAVPQTLDQVAEREKDIRFSSRTRLVSSLVRERHQLLSKSDLPATMLVHVIHHRKPYESQNKDYEFSRLSMREHWQAGQSDMAASIQLLESRRPPCAGGFCVLDYQSPVQERRFGDQSKENA